MGVMGLGGRKIALFTVAVLIAFLMLAPSASYADGVGGTQRYLEVRGAKLYTQIYGRGPPIVFLHGGMAFFDNSFAKQRDYFATYRTVVGIDQRGYGHSPDGPWSLSYQMMADDTAAIIEQLGLGPVDIVGHSVDLTRFGGHLSVYQEGVNHGEQAQSIYRGISATNGGFGPVRS